MQSQFGTKQKLSITLISSAILLTSLLGGCNNLHSAESLIADAQKYHQKGDDKAAVIQLKNALQKNADHVEARLLLGQIYIDGGDALSAEKEARKAISLGAEAARTLPLLGNALLLQGQHQKVIDELRVLNPPDANVLSLRGNAYLALGNKEAAKNAFDGALKAKADYPDALIGLAKLALANKNIEEASHLAEQAVRANPEHMEAWYFKGDLHRIRKQSGEALAAYDKTLAIKPGNAYANVQKALIEIGEKQYAQARMSVDAAKKASPNAVPALYADALLNFSQGKHAAANETLLQVLRQAPEYMPGLLLSGAVQLELGSTQQAEQNLKKYLDKDPDNLYANKLLVSALLKNGQTDRAIALVDAAVKRVPEDAQLLGLAGEVHARAKNFSRATEYYEKATALAPKAAQVYTALAVSRIAQGEDRRAISALETAASLDEKSTTAGIMLIMTHAKMKNYDQALAVARQLEKEHANNPMIANLQGGVYLEKKDTHAARASFEKALSIDPAYYPAAANLAQLDMQDKNPGAAKKRFENILSKDKKSFQAMAALAAIALKDGKKDDATAWLEKAVKENPDELRPSMLLAGHYLRLGEKQKALTVAQNLQSLNPANPEILEFLGQAHLAADNREGALDAYKKLTVLRPESAALHLKVASLHMAMNNEVMAADEVKKALALQPELLDAQLAQAMLDMKGQRYDQVLRTAKQIQRQDDKSPVGYALEGDVLGAQNQPELAAKAYEQAYTRGKVAPVLVKLHESLKKSGNDKEADARIGQWVKEHPNDVQVRMYLGTSSLLSKQNKAAISHFEQVLKVDPKNVVALNNLASVLHEDKDSRALKYAEKAYELAPKSAPIADTLGWILVEQNDIARGLPLLKQANAIEPASLEIRYHLAVALMKSGDKTAARKELEQILASGKKFSQSEEAQSLLKTL